MARNRSHDDNSASDEQVEDAELEAETLDASAQDTTVIAELEDDDVPAEVLEFDALTASDEGDAKTPKPKGWSRVFRGNKGLWVTAAIAVVALVAGLLIGHFITSPADAANNAEAPKPGLVTVPVEYGELSNDVTIRSDVGFADAVEVKLDTTSFTGGAVVTGQVPAVGAELKPLSIVAEVAGRPVFVLPGDLPSYRTLRIGVSGPDVVQLKQALTSLGINAGDVNNNVFDQTLADAISALYAQVGYPLPPSQEGADEAYRSAQEMVTTAQETVNQAYAALDKVQNKTVDPVQEKQANVAVTQAERDLANAENAVPRDEDAVAQARDTLELAVLQRDALYETPDTTSESSAITSAETSLANANEALEEARQDVQPYLPSSEVLYLSQLPRIVNQVNIARGKIVEGVAMTVSGATLQLSGTVAAADGKLLEAGTKASFAMPDDSQHEATITKVEPGKAATDRWTITMEPAPFTPEEIQQIQGTNVRVQIPVGATDGEVLSVPPSALTAGPGGESRVEVVVGNPKDGEKAETRLVTVKTGLAANGYVEVTPIKGKLEAGDLVVVGS